MRNQRNDHRTVRQMRAAVACGFSALALLAAPHVALAAEARTYEQLNLFGEALDRVRNAYVEEVADELLIEAAINGLLASLDPLSRFFTVESYAALQLRGGHTYDGLGLEVTMEGGVAKVIAPIDGSPAARIGLRAGDLIVEVDGTPVFGMTLSQAVQALQEGPPGSMVDLTIVRGGVDPFVATLGREEVGVPQLSFSARGGRGYVRIPLFTDETEAALNDALAQLVADLGDDFEGIVLDLRNTPGGPLEAALAVADAFLEGGEVVTARGRLDDDVQRFMATPGDLIEGRPIVVLIDGGSASAAEIVAGALKDGNRAIVIGTQSFGKGSAQTIVPMGDLGFVQLTTAFYHTPSGSPIEGQGVTPEIVIEPSVVVLDERWFSRRSERTLRGALDVPADDADAAAEAGEEDAEESVPDYQLARAFDLLRGLALVYQSMVAN